MSAKSSLFANLEVLREEYKTIKKEYRTSIYRILEQAALISCAASEDSKNRRQLLRGIGSDPKESIVKSVVGYLVGAGTKRALKYSRVLIFLLDVKEIKADEIAKYLKSKGGVEKVARMAAEENPKIKRKSKHKRLSDKPRSIDLFCPQRWSEKLVEIPVGTKMTIIGKRTRKGAKERVIIVRVKNLENTPEIDPSTDHWD